MPPAVLRRCSLHEAGLGGAPVELFKEDRRSRVWRVGDRVVKRFVHAPLRQRAALLCRQHPAQRELRAAGRLAGAGVPVVPIVAAGVEPAGAGCTVWLATPLSGSSLQRRLAGADEAEASALLEAAACLAARLIDSGFAVRDLKPSNIVIGDDGTARLIDTGSARRQRRGDVERMLAVMERALRREEVGEDLRRKFADAVRKSTSAAM